MRRTAVNSPNAPRTDEALLDGVRSGDRQAFAELWARHWRAGLRAAQAFSDLSDPEDLVTEAYTQIFGSLQDGKGPSGAFRPYLYGTIRNLAMRARRGAISTAVGTDPDSVPSDGTSTEAVERAIDHSLTATAFRSLPERWQAVLWYTEVERMSPAQAAPLLALSPNAVAALAYRARTALRAAWLQGHVADTAVDEACSETLLRIGEYAQGTLTDRQERAVRAHLRTCTRCSIVADEVEHVAGRIAVVMLPLLLGGSAAALFGQWIDAGIEPAVASAQSGIAQLSMPDPGFGALAGAGQTVAGGFAAGFPLAAIAIGVAAVMTVVAIGVAVVTLYLATPTRAESATSETSETADTEPVGTVEPGIVGTDDEADAAADPNPIPSAPATDDPATGDPAVDEPSRHPSPSQPSTTPPGSTAPENEPSPDPVVTLPAPDVAETPKETTNPEPVLSGTGTPGATVTISVAGVVVATVTVSSSGTWSWPSSGLLEGQNLIEVTQSEPGSAPSPPTIVELIIGTISPLFP